VGAVLGYSIDVVNSGTVTVYGVVVTGDPSTAGTCTKNAPGAPVGASAPAAGPLGIDLDPGESMTCSASYTVTQDDIDAGSVKDTATADGTTSGQSPVTASDSTTILAVNAELSVELSSSTTSFRHPGDAIDYSITVTNIGNVVLDNFVVTDSLVTIGTCTVVPAAAVLQPGESFSCPASYSVVQADIDAGSYTNRASASAAAQGGSRPTGSVPLRVSASSASAPGPLDVTSADVITPAIEDPAVTITETADESAITSVGTLVTFTIKVENTGNVRIDNVNITNYLNGISALDCGAFSGTLVPDASVQCTATYTTILDDLDAGSIVDNVEVTGTPSGGVLGHQSDSLTIPVDASPGLTLVKTADQSTYEAVGDVLTYAITVTNTGKLTISDVDVSDPLADAGSLSCDYTLPTLQRPGDVLHCTAEHTVTQADLDAGSVVNTASATGTPSRLSIGTVQDSATSTAVAHPALGVQQTTTDTSFDSVGHSIPYTITITNTGNVRVGNVGLDDPLGANISCTPALGSALEPGESIVCTADHVVTQADLDAGRVANRATPTGSPVAGTLVATAGEATTDAVQSPSLELRKSGTFDAVAGTITYTYVISNTGNVTLFDVGVSEDGGSFSGTASLPVAIYSSGGGDLDLESDAPDVAPGDTVTFQAVYHVSQADRDAGHVTNQAVGNASDPNGEPVSDDSNDAAAQPGEHVLTDTQITQSPAFTISTTVTSDAQSGLISRVRLGEPIGYHFTITNTGDVTLHGVDITDALPGLSCEPTAPSTLAPGSSMTCDATYTVSAADEVSGSLSNLASGSATAPVLDPQNPPAAITHDSTLALEVDPAPQSDTNATVKNESVGGRVLDNDLGTGLHVSSYDTVSQRGGQISMRSDGTYTYTPKSSYCGLESFTYTVTNSSGHASTSTVTITVFCQPLPSTGMDTDGPLVLALLFLGIGTAFVRRRRTSRPSGYLTTNTAKRRRVLAPLLFVGVLLGSSCGASSGRPTGSAGSVTTTSSDASGPASTSTSAASGAPGGPATTARPATVISIVVQPNTAAGFVGARADVSGLSCAATGALWAARGLVTNPTDHAVSYRIYVSLLDETHGTRAVFEVDVDRVEANASRTWEGRVALGATGLSCVLRVERTTLG
jgi:uncharacterized repeat protein (TIGR01451 family)/LPXTG-motif cell wall-anchored protein